MKNNVITIVKIPR